MIHIVTVLLVASLCAFGMVAAATKSNSPATGEYGETMSHLILQERSVLSGLVLETKQGLSITTNRGTFLLKGANLSGFVGKNVWVSGVIRDQSIFAVRVDVKS